MIRTLWDVTGELRIGIVLGAVKLDPGAVDHRAQGAVNWNPGAMAMGDGSGIYLPVVCCRLVVS